MVSFWEQQSLLSYDVIVIGAGITGLSTAASLKEKSPNLNILVIERGSLPTGASTKNAGFACFGSISELAQDRKALGDEGMTRLVKRRWDGLQKTIQRLGRDQIGFLQKGGYELLTEANSHYLDDMESLNELLRPVFDQPVFSQADEAIDTFGFAGTKHLIFNQYEGQLHTGKLIRSLWQYCAQSGIQIITGTEVTALQSLGQQVTIQTKNYAFRAGAVAVCTNAFTKELIQTPLDLTPGRGMVMVISPQRPSTISGTFHYDEGYYYFRDFEDKIIFGGGRNLAFEEETTTEFGFNEKIEQKLHQILKEIILPGNAYTVDLKWSGIMAFGQTKEPILQKVQPGIYLGVRLGGMGVALGSLLGEELAERIVRDGF